MFGAMTYHNSKRPTDCSFNCSIMHDSCSIQSFMQEDDRNSWHLNCTNLHYYALPSSIIFVVISEQLLVQFFLFMVIRLIYVIWVSGHDLVPSHFQNSSSHSTTFNDPIGRATPILDISVSRTRIVWISVF